MKRIFLAFICIMLAAAVLSACGDGSDNPSGDMDSAFSLTGTTKEITAAAVKNITGIVMGQLESMTVTNETTQTDAFDTETLCGYTGVAEAALSEHCVEAMVHRDLVNSSPYETVVIKCNSAMCAGTTAGLIKDSFDPARWVCAFPDICETITVGNYCFLVVGLEETVRGVEQNILALAGGDSSKLTITVFYGGTN